MLELIRYSKTTAVLRKCPHVIVGQFTKDEELEGSNKTIHQGDVVIIGRVADDLEIDGVIYNPPEPPADRNKTEPFRILATETKNRFAPLNELYFTSHNEGLRPFSPKPGIKAKRKAGKRG